MLAYLLILCLSGSGGLLDCRADRAVVAERFSTQAECQAAGERHRRKYTTLRPICQPVRIEVRRS